MGMEMTWHWMADVRSVRPDCAKRISRPSPIASRSGSVLIIGMGFCTAIFRHYPRIYINAGVVERSFSEPFGSSAPRKRLSAWSRM